MTDGNAGWFKDPSDPSLARWHDGENWTEHTLVIADQVPGVEPTPPVDATTAGTHLPRHGRSSDGDDEPGRLRALPLWAKVGVPALLVVLGILAVSLVSGGDDGDDKTETVDTVAAALDDAVDAARLSGLPTSITDAQAGRLIERICAAAKRPSLVDALGQDLGRLPVLSTGELRSSIDALGDGARTLCAEDLRDQPDLINDLQSAAVAAFTTTTTAPTIAPEGTDAGVDGAAVDPNATATTRKRTTSTTRKPTTATTRAPATTTTTAAPTTTLQTVNLGGSCSSEGATAMTQNGKRVTSARNACTLPTSPLVWKFSACPPPTTTTLPPG